MSTRSTPFVRRERESLGDLMLEVGPDVPTLCTGWTTRDLLDHLLVRERAPWAAAGIVVPPLAPLTALATRRVHRVAWPDAVARFRTPPAPLRPVAALDALVNTVELVVHHEDVRRGAGLAGDRTTAPRPLHADDRDEVWRALLRMRRVLARPARTGLVALRTDTGERHVLRPGPEPVTITGDPVELLLFCCGRSASQVEVTGSPAALASLDRSAFGF
ncbi:TIGR03085 family metal-binding protein [Nocardioides sp. GY 10127]|uniref:TIGR03085 family metal-binding protein n=1 Tax=Nocardioides sp. GY 10127 TaxID=2569762 RepID=UPI0010A8B430|nr:TIGR03085 family metal-binding protein [Nocardioides sp. GY 10127]TIC81004.1 TIGR03085 family protein [Nocardioides sp. GY 10127]